MSENLSKTFMGQSEPLSLSVFLPVRGYVPGQTIPIKITLTNTSHVDVKKFRIVFKKVRYYSPSDVHEVFMTLNLNFYDSSYSTLHIFALLTMADPLFYISDLLSGGALPFVRESSQAQGNRCGNGTVG